MEITGIALKQFGTEILEVLGMLCIAAVSLMAVLSLGILGVYLGTYLGWLQPEVLNSILGTKIP